MNDLLTSELSDLRLFADPFEAFTGVSDVDGWKANFVRKGEDVAMQREADGTIRTLVGPGQRKYRNFKGMLVSEAFANLERLASAQRHRTARLVDSDTGSLKEFLSVAGEIRWDDSTSEPLTYDRVLAILERSEERLRIVVIDGSAGVGKSHLIERIVHGRADPSSYKSGKPLLLHIESRGKVLTSLNDRIAGTLSSLRASFFEEELKPLIRRGAVQLAIDGFDELSDSRGYARAWGALRDFIRDLEGKGTCILAGRDTMLDQATVRHGLGNVVGDGDLVLFRVQHPPADRIRAWLSHRTEWCNRNDALDSFEQRIEGSEYLRRPFFVSRIADLGPDRWRDAQGEPVAELMESIVRREAEKLSTVSADIDTDLAGTLFGDVLAEVARYMVDDESNEIESAFVGLLLEEAFTDHANPEMVKALVQRAGALALLEEDPGDGSKRTFLHETVRSYFFGRSVFDYFPVHGATTGLHRVPLSADDFRIFNRVARRRSPGDQRTLRASLLAKLREPNGYDYLRSNIGGLLLCFAPLEEDGDDDEELVLSHLAMRDVWMADLLGTQRIRLDGCHMHRLDVRGANLRKVRFSNTEVYELLVDPFVRFGPSAPNAHSIIVYEHYRESRLFEGTVDWIAKRSDTPGLDDAVPDERWRLLEKFARISMRQYSIRSVGDQMDHASRVLESAHWTDLRALLERHGRLEVSTTLAASGPKSEWFHLVAGQEFLNPEPTSQESTRRILEELNAWPRKGA